MNITLHQLNVFNKVAELRSVTKASIALHMTQPAVSNILKMLNTALGSPAFEVCKRKIHLTATGHLLLNASKEIEASLNTVKEKIAAQSGHLIGSLNIASVSTAKYFILRLLGAFKKLYPQIHIRLVVKNRNAIMRRLEDNADDFVIMSQLPKGLSFEHELFFLDQLVVAVPPRHPLLSHSAIISIQSLQDERWLIREEGSGTRIAMSKLFKSCKMNPTYEMELDNNESIKQAIISNMGISILSQQSIELELANQLLFTAVIKEFPIAHPWYLVKNHGKKLSLIAQTFYDFVQSHPEAFHLNQEL